MLAVVLDVGKGAAPLLFAQANGLHDWALVPVGLSPVIGHAFSPWLRFHGGKAIAATFGMWLGLGITPALALAISMGVVHAVQRVDAWTVALGFCIQLGFLLLAAAPFWMVVMWLGCAAVVGYRQRTEMRLPPSLRSWVAPRTS